MKNSIIYYTLRNNPAIIRELGERLYEKIAEVVTSEWHEAFNALTKEDCYNHIHKLIINHAFDGYRTEIETIYGQLEGAIGMKIKPAPDNWDRTYNVDFYIQIEERYIGIQIKPINSGQSLNHYQWIEMHKVNHEKFEKKFGGKVFFVYSTKVEGKKRIYNVEVIDQIQTEIERLRK